jgi:DNA-damage-inducible protein D
MKNEILNPNGSVFEQIKQIDAEGNEYWMARQLSKILEYNDFRNFISVIEKAKELV